jgi:hypothetical protein
MTPDTLAPVPDVWRVAMVAGAGADQTYLLDST